MGERKRTLPNGWVGATIGEVTFKKVPKVVPDKESFFTYVDISSIDNVSKEIVSPKKLTGEQAPSRARQRIAVNDVLVSMTRPNLNAVALVPESLNEAIASTGFDVLRSIEVEPKWLYLYVQSREFVGDMSALVKGALYPAIKSTDVRSYRIRIPPHNEQKRIVAKIEELHARSRRAQEALETVPDLLEQLRQSILAAAFRGDLTKEWREMRSLPAQKPGSFFVYVLKCADDSNYIGITEDLRRDGMNINQEKAASGQNKILHNMFCIGKSTLLVKKQPNVKNG